VTGAALQVAPNILSIAHRDRLLGGALYAPLSRVGTGHPLAPHLRRGRHALHRVRRTQDGRAVVTAPVSIDRLLAALRGARDPPLAA